MIAKKTISTFDREMKNARFKKEFDKQYKQLLLSDSSIAIKEKNSKKHQLHFTHSH